MQRIYFETDDYYPDTERQNLDLLPIFTQSKLLYVPSLTSSRDLDAPQIPNYNNQTAKETVHKNGKGGYERVINGNERVNAIWGGQREGWMNR